MSLKYKSKKAYFPSTKMGILISFWNKKFYSKVNGSSKYQKSPNFKPSSAIFVAKGKYKYEISSEHKWFLSSYLLRIDYIIQKPIFLPGCDYLNNCFYNYKKFFQMQLSSKNYYLIKRFTQSFCHSSKNIVE